MFDNITRLIEGKYKIAIEAERYGKGYLVGLDAPEKLFGNIVAELMDIATSSGDVDAINAFEILEDFSKKYDGFLYARADSIYEALCKLEQNASFRNNMDVFGEEEILNKLERIKLEKNL